MPPINTPAKSCILDVGKYPQTAQLVTGIKAAFADGAVFVSLVQDAELVATIPSRAAAEQAMARRVAEHWATSPEVIDELAASFQEAPKKW